MKTIPVPPLALLACYLASCAPNGTGHHLPTGAEIAAQVTAENGARSPNLERNAGNAVNEAVAVGKMLGLADACDASFARIQGIRGEFEQLYRQEFGQAGDLVIETLNDAFVEGVRLSGRTGPPSCAQAEALLDQADARSAVRRGALGPRH